MPFIFGNKKGSKKSTLDLQSPLKTGYCAQQVTIQELLA